MSWAVIVVSWGTDTWRDRGDRAAASVEGADEVIRMHHTGQGDTEWLRNRCAREAVSDWLLFLDADDELAPGFITAMRTSVHEMPGNGILRTPALLYRQGGSTVGPIFHAECELHEGNWLPVCTAVSRELFIDVGGFACNPEFGGYGDWELWIRCVKAGARILRVPDAVYVLGVEPDSWMTAPHEERARWHYAVGHLHYPKLFTPDWLDRWGTAPE